MFRVVLALAAIVLPSLMSAVRAPATPHMEVAARAPEDLRQQVVRLFEELDEVKQAIETVQAEAAWVRERISVLSRQIEARQQLLNQRAAEAYMGERAVGFDSVLGAGSFTDLQDSLEFLDAVSQRDHEVLVSLEERKQEVQRQRVRLERSKSSFGGNRSGWKRPRRASSKDCDSSTPAFERCPRRACRMEVPTIPPIHPLRVPPFRAWSRGGQPWSR